MASIGKIARRSFLIGSAAIAGGVAFGAWKMNQPVNNPLTSDGDTTALNPFIVIDRDGVTVITPRAEMGQGVHTTLAALAAEELDLAWEDVRVLHGPASTAYYNSAILGASLPFKDYAMTGFQHRVADTVDKVNRLMGIQATGGSTSMKDGYDRLRHAGASARETLKRAASARLGVDVSELKTESGAVIAPDGTTIPYPELAEAAAQIAPPQVELRPKSDWRYLGRTMPRVDMVGKVTGTAEFGIDVRQPGLKFATLRINPRLGGAMVSYDASAAEKLPGVEKIVPLDTGIAVIASNTWLAFQAADAVEIEWGDAPYPSETDAIFDEIAASFDTSPNSTLRDDGDVSAPVDGGTEITAEYRVPFLAHATMEPMNATALYTGDALELWCGNQGPTVTRDKCAAVVGLDPDAVTVHSTLMGGGFGRRGEFDFAVSAAQVAKAIPGTPVQLTWSREEDMRHDFYRPAAIGRYRGIVSDGAAVTLDGRVAAPSAAAATTKRLIGLPWAGPDKVHVEGAFDQPYGIPNYRIEGYLTPLEVPVGFWRSVGNSINAFMHDSFIDEMAHAAGRDPLAFRLDLIRGQHAPSAAVLEEVRDMCGWTGQTPEGIGRGVAFAYSFGTPVAQVIEVAQTADGIRINRVWIAADLGTALDPGNLEAQLTGGMIYGLTAAVMGEITFAGGEVEQGNFPDYDALRMHTAPRTQVKILEANAHMGGAGEPGTPPAAPALGNALFDLTGIRARVLPFSKSFDFLA